MESTQQDPYPYISPEQVEKLKIQGLCHERLEKCNEISRKEFEEVLKKFTFSPKIRVVLIGGTGSGKSTAGNIILGRDVFKTDLGTDACTTTVQYGESAMDGTILRVIDTPGFVSDALAEDSVKIINLFPEGIDIFFFVFNLARPNFSDEQRDRLQKLKVDLKDDLFRHCAALLTHGKSLLDQNKSLDEFLEDNNETSFGQLLLETFEGRVIAMEGIGTSGEIQRQTRHLRSFLRSIVERLDYQPYSDSKYKDTVASLDVKLSLDDSVVKFKKPIERFISQRLCSIRLPPKTSSELVAEVMKFLYEEHKLNVTQSALMELEKAVESFIMGKVDKIQKASELSGLALFEIMAVMNSKMITKPGNKGRVSSEPRRRLSSEPKLGATQGPVKVTNMPNAAVESNLPSSSAVQTPDGNVQEGEDSSPDYPRKCESHESKHEDPTPTTSAVEGLGGHIQDDKDNSKADTKKPKSHGSKRMAPKAPTSTTAQTSGGNLQENSGGQDEEGHDDSLILTEKL